VKKKEKNQKNGGKVTAEVRCKTTDWVLQDKKGGSWLSRGEVTLAK